MNRSLTARWSAGALVAALSLTILVGCGGDDSSSGKSSPSPTFDSAAAMTQIKTNWETFFDATKPIPTRVALLEDAASLQAALAAQAKNPQARSTSARVTKVVVDPSHASATVTYNIYIGKSKVTNNSTGQAVLATGTWKVSKGTFCGLAALAAPSGKVPGCS